jgi:hypothetical protein
VLSEAGDAGSVVEDGIWLGLALAGNERGDAQQGARVAADLRPVGRRLGPVRVEEDAPGGRNLDRIAESAAHGASQVEGRRRWAAVG